MHVETLKTYVDLVDTRNFSRAARLNGLSQSAVSQQLRAMEAFFMAPLLDRSSKGFRLTLEGEKLNAAARDILARYNKVVGELQELRNQITGKIKISTIHTIGFHELPPFVKQFLENYPSVDIRIEYRRFNHVVEDVLQNEADLGLVAYPAPDKNLEIIPFAQDQLVVICNPGHPLAARREITLSNLAGKHFIGFDQDIPTRRAIDALFQKNGIKVSLVRESDNVETLKSAVEIGLGLALVPSSSIRQEVARGTLVALNIKDSPIPPRPLAVIHRKGFVLTPAMRKFIALIGAGGPALKGVRAAPAASGGAPRT